MDATILPHNLDDDAPELCLVRVALDSIDEALMAGVLCTSVNVTGHETTSEVHVAELE
jgi:hypothetical protein